MDYSPLIISLKTAFLATFITFFLGLYAARRVAKVKHCKGLIDGIFTLPMVLPPTVVGFFLIIIFGNNSFVGILLAKINITVMFSWSATVLSACVVSFPLMYRTARGAFEQIDTDLVYAARTLGMSERAIFWKVVFPVSWPGVAAGTVLSFARALGEFGATIMIAGNIPGRTQTVSTAIYTAVQSGDRATAYTWAGTIVMISFATMMMMNYWSANQKKLISGRTEK